MSQAPARSHSGPAGSVTPFAVVAPSELAETLSAVAATLPAHEDEAFSDESVQRRLVAAFASTAPGWADLSAKVAERFDSPGIVLVRGLSFDPSNRLLVALLASLGTVVTHRTREPRVVYDLYPIERPPDRPDFELDFHTGSYFQTRPHEILALLCVQPGSQGGGASKLAPLDALLATMRRQGQAEAVERLVEQPVRFNLPRRLGGGYLETPILAPLADDPSRLGVRFERRRVLGDARGRPIGYDPALLAAIAAFEAAANTSGSYLEYALEANELLILDNRRVLHARGPVPGGLASGRHLKRVKAYRP